MQQHDELLEISVETPSVSIEHALYDVYYRQHGIRRMNQLDTPIISDIGGTVLPKFSIYHYNPESPLLFGPLENNPWFVNDSKLRFIRHIGSFLSPPIGTIQQKPGQIQQYVNAYRRKHRTLKLLRDFFGVNKSSQMLMVVNYCLLNQLWKYRPHRLVNYYKFFNLYQTIMTQMDKLASQSDRQQYFEIRLPKILHPRATLRTLSKEYERGINNKHIQAFNDDDSWLLFHLWLWVGTQQNYSIFNKIQEHHLSKINLLITDQGKYVLINLGKLHEWRSLSQSGVDEDGNLIDDLEGNSDDAKSERLQVKFYKLLDIFFSTRTGNGVREIEVPNYTEDDLNDTSDNDNDDEVLEETDLVTSKNDEPKKTQGEKIGELVEELVTGEKQEDKQKGNKSSKLKPIPVDELQEDTLDDEDEETSEPVTVVNTEPFEIDEPEYQPTEETELVEEKDTMVSAILEDALELVEAGQMTAKQYERIKQKAEAYKTAPSPYFEGETLEQTAHVPLDVLTNIEKREVPDNPWIIDKSMLKVTTESVTQTYLSKVYNRNIVQSILSLQKGGILVTDIKREEFRDSNNHYEILSITTQPIDGVEKTMKIRLPIPDVDTGELVNNGVRYTLKKLRRDLPIRKVSPTKVSLTTYYGKLFVVKSDRKLFNLEKYYINNIQAKMFDGTIDEVNFGNVFDKLIENIHPNYQMIAKKFESFTYRSPDNRTWYTHFNYKTRDSLLKGNVELLTKLETQLDATIFATDSLNKEHLFIDNKSGLVYSSNVNLPPTTLEKFLDIIQSPPLEMAEIKIFSKSIPLGILLGYYLGLSKLCKLLNVKYRKVFRGSRSNLLETEYEIKFGDETWIFDKRDYKAQLILNGFNQYRRYLGDYSAQQFEQKDVYMSILREAGIPLSFENEFKLLKRMFIDDISKSLLEQIKEPTEFIPLLVRAAELLTKMWSRDEINMEDMVISGYDRIAGHVYSELVRNLKAMNNAPTQARKRFDLPQTHIMQQIMKDPSMAIVDDINPIHNLKEHDIVTFNGTGGRSSRSMVSHTRAYHETDLGTISEQTVDNSNVGTITYLTASPEQTSIYGTFKPLDKNNYGSANVLSSAGNTHVCSDTDDQLNSI